MKASIIITSFNRSELLMYDLDSLVRQNLKDTEILVLNDGDPHDGTEGICEMYSDDLNIRYFATKRDHTQWRVPGFAINYGLQQSKGKFIFLSCAEMYHMGNTVENMIAVLEKQPKSMVIPKGKDDDGKFLNKLKQHIAIQEEDCNCLKPLINIHFPFFMGLCKEQIMKIGGYDEDFVGVGFDDNDIVYRLGRAGCKLISVNSIVIHLYHPRLKFNNKDIHQRLKFNEALFHKKRAKKEIIRNKNRKWGELF